MNGLLLAARVYAALQHNFILHIHFAVSRKMLQCTTRLPKKDDWPYSSPGNKTSVKPNFVKSRIRIG